MKKVTFEEYCEALTSFYRGYNTIDVQLKKLIVRNIQDIKRKYIKEKGEER